MEFYNSNFLICLGFLLKFWGIFYSEADREVVVDMGQIKYSDKYFDDTYEYR